MPRRRTRPAGRTVQVMDRITGDHGITEDLSRPGVLYCRT
jgi:hypothetical protein